MDHKARVGSGDEFSDQELGDIGALSVNTNTSWLQFSAKNGTLSSFLLSQHIGHNVT